MSLTFSLELGDHLEAKVYLAMGQNSLAKVLQNWSKAETEKEIKLFWV